MIRLSEKRTNFNSGLFKWLFLGIHNTLIIMLNPVYDDMVEKFNRILLKPVLFEVCSNIQTTRIVITNVLPKKARYMKQRILGYMRHSPVDTLVYPVIFYLVNCLTYLPFPANTWGKLEHVWKAWSYFLEVEWVSLMIVEKYSTISRQ